MEAYFYIIQMLTTLKPLTPYATTEEPMRLRNNKRPETVGGR